MESLPPHLIPATRARKFVAGLLNLVSAGLLLQVARLVDYASAGAAAPGSSERLYTIGLVSALWLLYLLKKKSLGAAFCLLEIRGLDGAQPTLRQVFTRSAPIYAFAVSGIFPSGVLPSVVEVVRLILFLALLVFAFISGMIGVFSDRSLIDRISKTIVLQLNLPDDAKPRIFGIRIV